MKLFKAVFTPPDQSVGEPVPSDKIWVNISGEYIAIEKDQIYAVGDEVDLNADPYPTLTKEIVELKPLTSVLKPVKKKKKKGE